MWQMAVGSTRNDSISFFKVISYQLTRPWTALIIIAFVTGAIYSNIYRSPFVFDGVEQIENKVKIRDLRRYFSPRELFSPRPLVELTFALNYKIGKLNVLGYHLVNVLIHVINGFLVYFLALAIFKRLFISPAQVINGLPGGGYEVRSPKSEVRCTRPANLQSSIPLMSLFTALIFVAHPLQTQAVTYTVQRYTSMAAMFYFLSVLLYIKARLVAEGSKLKVQSLGSRSLSAFSFQLIAYFVLSFLCGILAFLCKQNAASLPGAILLVEYILFDRTWQGWKRKLVWFAPVFVLMGVFILYVSGIFRGGVQFGSLLEDVSGMLQAHGWAISPWNYLCTQLNVVVIYIRLLFLPVGQNLDYVYPFKTGFFDGYTPVAFLFLIAVIGLGVWNLRKRPIISLGIFWFFIALSVESSIFPISDALFEHRLYLPMFGFAIVAAYVVFCLLPAKRPWGVVIPFLVIFSIGTTTYLRNRTYQNGVILWSDVVSKSPQNFRAYYNLGNAFYRSKRPYEAIESYYEALHIKRDYVAARLNLGVVLMEVGQLHNALSHLLEAMRIRPGDAVIHSSLGNAFMRLGRLQDAVLQFSEAIRIDPKFAKAHNNLGIALAKQGNLTDALTHFSKALEIAPHNAEIHRNLAQALILEGKIQEAGRHLSEAVRLEPDDAKAHSKLGVVLMRQGDLDGGIEHFSKALQIRPGLGEARQGLERALRLKGAKNPANPQ